MKSTLRTFAALLVATTLTFAGCKKEKIEPITPETPGEQPVENIFIGTSWENHTENSFTYPIQGMNIPMLVEADMSIDFIDSVSGELFMDMSLIVPDYPVPPQDFSQTMSFTYTFNGEDSVKLAIEYYDEESGDTVQYEDFFVYDKAANTLTWSLGTEDAELLGVDSIVFTQRELGNAKAIIPGSRTATGKKSWQKLVEKVLRAME